MWAIHPFQLLNVELSRGKSRQLTLPIWRPLPWPRMSSAAFRIGLYEFCNQVADSEVYVSTDRTLKGKPREVLHQKVVPTESLPDQQLVSKQAPRRPTVEMTGRIVLDRQSVLRPNPGYFSNHARSAKVNPNVFLSEPGPREEQTNCIWYSRLGKQ